MLAYASMLKNVGRMSPYGLYAKHMLDIQYRYITHRSGAVDICGMKMYRTATVQYRTASVLIAYEYCTSKVCLPYLQRILTSWRMPDD